MHAAQNSSPSQRAQSSLIPCWVVRRTPTFVDHPHSPFTALRGRRDRRDHRALWRVPHGQVPAMPHPRRHLSVAHRLRRRRGQVSLHRHRRDIPPRPPSRRGREIRAERRGSSGKHRVRTCIQCRPPTAVAHPRERTHVRVEVCMLCSS